MKDSQRSQSPGKTEAAEVLLAGALPPLAAPGGCPTSEELAAFVDGQGTSSERAAVAAHIETCEACFAVVAGAADLAGEFDRVIVQPLPGHAEHRGWLARHPVA